MILLSNPTENDIVNHYDLENVSLDKIVISKSRNLVTNRIDVIL